MYRDTEQSYGDWTLDVYQVDDQGDWHVDYWLRGHPHTGGMVSSRKKKDAMAMAKEAIAAIERESS